MNIEEAKAKADRAAKALGKAHYVVEGYGELIVVDDADMAEEGENMFSEPLYVAEAA